MTEKPRTNAPRAREASRQDTRRKDAEDTPEHHAGHQAIPDDPPKDPVCGADPAWFAQKMTVLLSEASSAPIEDLRRAARTVNEVVRARVGILQMTRMAESGSAQDGAMDAEGEQSLRDALLGRLADLAAELEQAGLARCPGCGRAEPDRRGLERLGERRAETA